jgi:hypothetical protein
MEQQALMNQLQLQVPNDYTGGGLSFEYEGHYWQVHLADVKYPRAGSNPKVARADRVLWSSPLVGRAGQLVRCAVPDLSECSSDDSCSDDSCSDDSCSDDLCSERSECSSSVGGHPTFPLGEYILEEQPNTFACRDRSGRANAWPTARVLRARRRGARMTSVFVGTAPFAPHLYAGAKFSFNVWPLQERHTVVCVPVTCATGHNVTLTVELPVPNGTFSNVLLFDGVPITVDTAPGTPDAPDHTPLVDESLALTPAWHAPKTTIGGNEQANGGLTPRTGELVTTAWLELKDGGAVGGGPMPMPMQTLHLD